MPPRSLVRLDRGSLPSETLRSGSLETGQSRDVAEETVFKGIYPMAHRSEVPLQVFSGETTPVLGIGSPTITEGLRMLGYISVIFVDFTDRSVLVFFGRFKLMDRNEKLIRIFEYALNQEYTGKSFFESSLKRMGIGSAVSAFKSLIREYCL